MRAGPISERVVKPVAPRPRPVRQSRMLSLPHRVCAPRPRRTAGEGAQRSKRAPWASAGCAEPATAIGRTWHIVGRHLAPAQGISLLRERGHLVPPPTVFCSFFCSFFFIRSCWAWWLGDSGGHVQCATRERFAQHALVNTGNARVILLGATWSPGYEDRVRVFLKVRGG